MYQSMLVRSGRSAIATLSAIAFAAGLLLAPSFAFAAANVTPASNGTNVSIDTSSVAGGTPVFKTLNGPTITETAPGDIASGTHTISLPSGWEFKTDSTITIGVGGGDIVIQESETGIIPSQTSFSFTVTSASNSPSPVMFFGLNVRPTTTAPSTGNMTYSGSGIAGVDGSTNFGTLSTAAGTVTQLAFTTWPSATTVYGSNLSTQPVIKTQDQFGNDSTNGASGKTVTLTLAPDTGTLGGTVALDISGGTATFTDLYVDTVGAGKQLTASATGLEPAVSSSFEVTAKPLTATVTANDKTYNGDNTATVTAADVSAGLVYGDVVTADVGTSATFSDENAWIGKTVTATGITLSGDKATNYSFSGTGTGTANINQLGITVTPTVGQTKVYGSADSVFTYGFTPALIGPDTFTGTLSRVANENVGTHAYTIGTLEDGLNNYSLTLNPDTFAITQKPLTVIATGVEREYDQTTDATVTLSSADEVLGDNLVYAYTSASFLTKTAENGKTVNVIGISIDGAKSGNYALQSTEALTTANVTKKPITLTINVDNKTYDGDTSATYSASPRVLNGVIAGDTVVAENTGSKAFENKNVDVAKTVNATGITLSGADKDNYEFDGTGTGTATINVRPITVTAATDSRTYNGTDSSSGTPVITNTGSLTTGPIMGTDQANFTQTYDDKNVGTNKTLTPSGSVTDGNGGNNYAVTFVNNTTGVITQAPLTATVTVEKKVVDSNNFAVITGVSFGGVIDGETVTADFSGATATFADAEVGDGKVVTASGITISSGNELGNYSYSGSATGAGTILAVPTTVYVDDNWAETEAWANPDGDGPATYFGYDAFATIQEAIDAVDAGGTVNILSGTYNITSTPGITISKSLTINGAGIDSTVVSGSTKDASVANGQDVLFNVTANNVTIKNLTIDLGDSDSDYDVGIFTPNNGGINNLVVQDSKLLYAAYGNSVGEQLIHLGGGSGATISGNTMETASGNSGLYVGDGTNTLLTVSGNTVAPVSDADGGGTFFNQMGPVTNSTINGNNFTDTGIAIYLGAGSSNTDTVTVSNNTFTSNNGHSSGLYGAIAVTSEVDGVNTQNITITDNIFTGSQVAAAITIFDSVNTSVPNVIGDTISITNNTFATDNFGNINVGLGVSGIVNAENNYWGTAVLATIDDSVVGSAGFDPYYVDSAKTILSSTAPSAVYVDDNYFDGSSDSYYFGYDAFATIQEGIEAVVADGTGSVNVAAGTYVENVAIDKSLTLRGDPGAQTESIGDAGPGTSAPVLNGTGLSGSAITLSLGVTNVLIEGFEVHNYTDISDGGMGAVTSWNTGASNITVQDNFLHDIGWNGVLVGSDNDSTQSNWTVKRNIVSGTDYAGIELTNVTNSQVLDNEITGPTSIVNDPGDAGVGIEIATRARVGTLVAGTGITVSGNEITGAFAAGSRTAINLLSRAYDSVSSAATLSGVTVSGNIITGSGTRGVNIVAESRGGHSATVSGLAITSNTLSGNTAGIEIGLAAGSSHANGTYNAGTITIEENKIDGNTAGLENTTGTVLDASANWWGDASGPMNATTNPDALGDTVSDNVTFRPWYLSELDLNNSDLDSTAPTVALTYSANPAKAGVMTITVTYSEAVTGTPKISIIQQGSAEVSNADMSGSGAVWTYAYTVNTATGGTYIDGTATVSLSSVNDPSGNIAGSPTGTTFTIDTVAPTATITAGAPASLTNITTTDITVGGTDVVTYQYKLDDGTYSVDTPIATHITLSGVAEGEHMLYVRGSDVAGNLQAAPGTANATWTVDTQVPEVSITSIAGDNYINNSEKGAIVVVGTAEADASVSVSLTNGVTVSGTQQLTGGGTAYSITIDGTTLTNGTITPSVTATDAAGNVSDAATTPTATKDTSAPSVTSKSPDASAVGVDPTGDITVVFDEDVVIGADNVTGVTADVTGTGTDTVTINPTSDLASNTTYTITLTGVTDTAGNALPTTIWTFTTAGSYSFTLTNGWNLVALGVVPNNTSISTILGSSSSNVESIWSYDAVTNVWSVYRPNGSGNLSSMTAGNGYWVNYTSASPVTLSGSGNLFLAGENTPPSRTLKAGWNLLGYYQRESNTTALVTNALKTLKSQDAAPIPWWSMIVKHDNSAKQFGTVENNNSLSSGQGYWILMGGRATDTYIYAPGVTDQP